MHHVVKCAPTGGFTVRQVGGTILLPALRNFLNGFGCRVRSGSQVPVGLFDRNDAAVQALKDEYVVFVIDQQTWLQGYMAAASAALAATLNMTIALPPAPDILATGPVVINSQSTNIGMDAERLWQTRSSIDIKVLTHYAEPTLEFAELSAGVRQASRYAARFRTSCCLRDAHDLILRVRPPGTGT
jgi:hypothetical protein